MNTTVYMKDFLKRFKFCHGIYTLTQITFALLIVSQSILPANAQNTETPSEFQSLETVHQLVLEHLKQKADQSIHNPEFKIRELSDRLKLKACQTALQIEDRQSSKTVGRMTIGVSCEHPRWRVYVPAEIMGKLPLIYSNHAILKGERISREDFRVELVPHNKIPPGAVTQERSLIGMRSKRAISANQVIKVQYLVPPYMVFKNQAVNIITRIGAIEVRSRGISLKNAVEGEQVDIQNQSSKKIIKGIVIAPNTVLVP